MTLQEARKRREAVIAMREKGFTYQQIGDYFKISRQAAHRILNPIDKSKEYKQKKLYTYGIDRK